MLLLLLLPPPLPPLAAAAAAVSSLRSASPHPHLQESLFLSNFRSGDICLCSQKVHPAFQ